MTTLVTLSVIAITPLIAGLAFFLYVLGSQLGRIATLLEECAELVWKIKGDTEVIAPGLQSINNTGGVVAGCERSLGRRLATIRPDRGYPVKDPRRKPCHAGLWSAHSSGCPLTLTPVGSLHE